MRLTNTPWVHHSGGAIYSLDLHPTAEKLATCGQGEIGGAGLVIIWNLRPILSERAGQDLEKNKPLLSKIRNQAGVNCVRWSRCGKNLACAGDDKTVTILEYGGRINSAGTVGQRKGETNLELYRPIHTLHDHTLEVLAVEWSWNGRFLASASMDNTIIIWNALRLPERVVVLDGTREGHTGHVKGLSWDPIGMYLASQSADKSLRLWRTDSWTCDQIIEKPFEESGQTTVFTRPDWSPDGQMLFAAGATNNQGPTVQIVRRKNWNMDLDLVGHRKAVTCVRACPRMFHYTDHTGKQLQVSCVAVGSRDKSVSIWVLPGVRRPLVVITSVFKHSIMDMSWKDCTLIVCSQDGTIKSFTLSEKELGATLSIKEMGDLCEEIYKSRPSHLTRSDGLGSTIGGAGIGSFIETPAELLASKAAEQRKKGREEQGRKEEDAAVALAAKVEKEMVETRKEQIEVLQKDGKRRIQPIFLGSTIEIVDEDEKKKSEGEEEKMDETWAETSKTPVSPVKEPIKRTITTKSVAREDKGEEVTSARSGKRKRSTTTTTATTNTEETEDSSEDSEEEAAFPRKRDPLLKTDFRLPVLRQLEMVPFRSDQSTPLLPLPDVHISLAESVLGSASSDEIAVTNDYSTGGVTVARVTLSHLGKISWTTFLPDMSLDGNCFFGSYTPCAAHAYRSLCFRGSHPARLPASQNWHPEPVDVRAYSERIFQCMTTITSVSLTISGTPVLCFSNGSSFAYSVDMQMWQVLDSTSPLLRLCEALPVEEMGDGLLGKILKKRKRQGIAPSVSLSSRVFAAESLMEGWMAASASLNSVQDMRMNIWAYTRQLVRHRSTMKLRYLLDWISKASISKQVKEEVRNEMEKIIASVPEMKEALRESDQVDQVLF